jgi:ssDNA-binding Zn-finger/Zn-ribbon topoisomerase 1
MQKDNDQRQGELTDDLECPKCGENRKAHLVWQSDEMLLCESCDQLFLARDDVRKITRSLFNLFASRVPDDYSYKGQSLFESCEHWTWHFITQLEAEIQEFTECGRDPRQSPGECPQCDSDRVALACCVNGHEFYHCNECSENGRLAVIYGAKNRFSCPYCDEEEDLNAEKD